jgi:DNA topoisomerase VI subunit A
MNRKEARTYLLALLMLTDNEFRYTRQTLVRATGMSDRAVRQEIHRLRKEDRVHIVSDTDRAGYYVGTSEQWNAFARRENKRAQNTFQTQDYTNVLQTRIEE